MLAVYTPREVEAIHKYTTSRRDRAQAQGTQDGGSEGLVHRTVVGVSVRSSPCCRAWISGSQVIRSLRGIGRKGGVTVLRDSPLEEVGASVQGDCPHERELSKRLWVGVRLRA